jgi:hypothetical protein
MSGATKWLATDKALLLLSLRHKTNDHLWLVQIPQQRHIWHINQLTLVKNPLDFLPKLMPLNHLRHFERKKRVFK